MLYYDSRKQRTSDRLAAWDKRGETGPDSLPIGALRELQANINGDVVLPSDPGYDADRKLANPRFDDHPEAIVYCEGPHDVGQCLTVVRNYNLQFVVRSGGHSTAGFSGSAGLTIDVSRMNDVTVDPEALRVWAGPGCDFAKFNAAIEAHDLHTPGGACPDVHVSGYMQGGGYGYTARIFGMHCDQVEQVTVMLASGLIVVANETLNADLYWAMRGGTGNNFGILLSTQYKVRRGATFQGWSVVWELEYPNQREVAANALVWLQENFMTTAPPEVGYQMIWAFQGEPGQAKAPYLLLRGVYDGSLADLEAALAPVLAVEGAQLQYYTGPMVYSKLSEHLMTTPYDLPEFPANTAPYPPPENKLSRYVERMLKPIEWQRLLGYFVATPSQYTMIAFEIYGGGINAVPPYETAFIHRSVSFDCFCDVFWLVDNDRPTMEAFLTGWTQRIDQMANGHSYQNYPSQDDPNYAAHYWGPILASLSAVKSKYDPTNMFAFPQSVPPSSGEIPEGVFTHHALEGPIALPDGTTAEAT